MKHLTRNTIVGFLFFAFYFFFAETSLAQSNQTPISSRDYLGIEIGASDNWLGGASSDFFFTAPYPYSDAGYPVNVALPFTDLGTGTGFQVGGIATSSER